MGIIYCDEGIKKHLGKFVEKAEKRDFKCDIYVLYGKAPEMVEKGSIIIANGDDTELLKSLSKADGTIITCGMSGVSTFTFSGMRDDRYVLCLQRAVNSFSGKMLQPQEVPVTVTGSNFDADKLILVLVFGFLAEINITTIKMEE